MPVGSPQSAVGGGEGCLDRGLCPVSPDAKVSPSEGCVLPLPEEAPGLHCAVVCFWQVSGIIIVVNEIASSTHLIYSFREFCLNSE